MPKQACINLIKTKEVTFIIIKVEILQTWKFKNKNKTLGSDFSGSAQDVWDFRPTSPVQRICREWAKELGFGVWTTVIMVFYSIG